MEKALEYDVEGDKGPSGADEASGDACTLCAEAHPATRLIVLDAYEEHRIAKVCAGQPDACPSELPGYVHCKAGRCCAAPSGAATKPR